MSRARLLRALPSDHERLPCRSVLFAAAVVFSAASSVACTHVRPWERGKLAHPSMATGGFTGPAEEHVHAVQEGATGGAGSAESGCGCN